MCVSVLTTGQTKDNEDIIYINKLDRAVVSRPALMCLFPTAGTNLIMRVR